jgi:hypothetical protein
MTGPEAHAMSPQPRTQTEERFWGTWDEFLTHGAGCANCRKKKCRQGTRLGKAHRDARKRLSRERGAK